MGHGHDSGQIPFFCVYYLQWLGNAFQWSNVIGESVVEL